MSTIRLETHQYPSETFFIKIVFNRKKISF